MSSATENAYPVGKRKEATLCLLFLLLKCDFLPAAHGSRTRVRMATAFVYHVDGFRTGEIGKEQLYVTTCGCNLGR